MSVGENFLQAESLSAQLIQCRADDSVQTLEIFDICCPFRVADPANAKGLSLRAFQFGVRTEDAEIDAIRDEAKGQRFWIGLAVNLVELV